jgi:hypothetical protein
MSPIGYVRVYLREVLNTHFKNYTILPVEYKTRVIIFRTAQNFQLTPPR